ncbi:alanine dehydrogenase [Streptomyces sp. RS10V-4]|uniref:alanine dehydrogenase n=1 Tax=Streptomyces rhizoryzae TaxID=2932493 RepID=UPI002006185E|nr:alanine dehydrogenase [Streptomyces rhizoryzae]MCK7623752.1 alanine dehydrogenase [Streptomyces rhizoryzae]
MEKLGVVANTGKKHERRVPTHPAHLPRLDSGLRSRLFLESGYGAWFGMTDDDLRPHVAGIRPRADLIPDCDALVLFKVTPQDVAALRERHILIGAPHFAQNPETTQLAIDKRLTVISMEAMRHWPNGGTGAGFARWVFSRVSEMAGYCSVQHALQCVGLTGRWGRPLRAAVIGFGSTGHGAVAALRAQGVEDLTLVTRRPSAAVRPPTGATRMAQLRHRPAPGSSTVRLADGEVPLPPFLAEHDIVVNCVLQDVTAPEVYLTEEDLARFAPGSLIVDVSCDTGMAFGWARPTSFDRPTRTVGGHVRYYAVDHSPSLLWNSATWELSQALLAYLPTLADPRSWDADETIRRAVEMRDGVIQNPSILAYQGRSPAYPHHPTTPASPVEV